MINPSCFVIVVRFVLLTNKMVAQNDLVALSDGAVANLIHNCGNFLAMIAYKDERFKTNSWVKIMMLFLCQTLSAGTVWMKAAASEHTGQQALGGQ